MNLLRGEVRRAMGSFLLFALGSLALSWGSLEVVAGVVRVKDAVPALLFVSLLAAFWGVREVGLGRSRGRWGVVVAAGCALLASLLHSSLELSLGEAVLAIVAGGGFFLFAWDSYMLSSVSRTIQETPEDTWSVWRKAIGDLKRGSILLVLGGALALLAGWILLPSLLFLLNPAVGQSLEARSLYGAFVGGLLVLLLGLGISLGRRVLGT